MTSLSARRQWRVLTRRYLSCTLGDPLTVLVLVLQAPFIGWLCTLVWGGADKETASLYFVMALSSVWFGCINACREVVKERAVLERERFFGLSLPAYVGSKLVVLSGLALVQVLLMQLAIEWQMALKGAYLIQTLAMWGSAICGTALGLVISAVARTQERAVGVIPLLILPQLLFSEMAVPEAWFTDLVSLVEKLMPVHWGFEVFQQLADTETEWGVVLGSLLALAAYSTVLAALAAAALIPRRELS